MWLACLIGSRSSSYNTSLQGNAEMVNPSQPSSVLKDEINEVISCCILVPIFTLEASSCKAFWTFVSMIVCSLRPYEACSQSPFNSFAWAQHSGRPILLTLSIWRLGRSDKFLCQLQRCRVAVQTERCCRVCASSLIQYSDCMATRAADKTWWFCVLLIQCVISCKITEFRQWYLGLA